MTDRPNPEALARVLSRAMRHQAPTRVLAEQAERILADPGPLLEALAEAGVLRQTSRVAYEITVEVGGERICQHGDTSPYGLQEALAKHPEMYRPGSRVERATTRWLTTEGVTEWRPTDARA